MGFDEAEDAGRGLILVGVVVGAAARVVDGSAEDVADEGCAVKLVEASVPDTEGWDATDDV